MHKPEEEREVGGREGTQAPKDFLNRLGSLVNSRLGTEFKLLKPSYLMQRGGVVGVFGSTAVKTVENQCVNSLQNLTPWDITGGLDRARIINNRAL